MRLFGTFYIIPVPDTAHRKASDREKDNLVRDRESKNSTLRQLGDELHKKELEESECRNQLRDKDELERRIEEMRAEITTAQARLKVWLPPAQRGVLSSDALTIWIGSRGQNRGSPGANRKARAGAQGT